MSAYWQGYKAYHTHVTLNPYHYDRQPMDFYAWESGYINAMLLDWSSE